MDHNLEKILLNLLIPDNSIIEEATKEIKKALKKPDVCVSLMSIVSSSQNIHVKQYAIVLLRQISSKKNYWHSLSDPFKQSAKETVLQKLLAEKERFICNALAELAGTIAAFELPNGRWPQLLPFIVENIKSDNVQLREVGALLLSIVVRTCVTKIQPYFPFILGLMPQMLAETENKAVLQHCITTMTSLLIQITETEMNVLQSLLPQFFFTIKKLVCTGDDSIAALEFFDELLGSKLPIVDSCVKPMTDLFFEFIISNTYEMNVKIRVLYLVGFLSIHQGKTLVKEKLVVPILKVLFPIMSLPSEIDDNGDDDTADYDETDRDDDDIIKVASKTLDAMALNLPPEEFMSPLLVLLEPAFRSQNPNERRAALMAIGMSCEGCSEYIRYRCLAQMMQHLFNGVNDNSAQVKATAFFALGQFSEHIKSDIKKYAAGFLQPFVEFLLQSCRSFRGNSREISKLKKKFQQFQSYCETCEPVLTPYLDYLIDHLLMMLKATKSCELKCMSLNVIDSLAYASKKAITPYIQRLFEDIKVYLSGKEDEESKCLEVESRGTLTALLSVAESGYCSQLCRECIPYIINRLETSNDPELNVSVYCLLASTCITLKEEIGQFLPVLVPCLLKSLRSKYIERKSNHLSVTPDTLAFFEPDDFSVKCLLDEESECDNDCSKVFTYEKHMSYNEKSVVCKVLNHMAYQAPRNFFPFIRECGLELFNMMNFKNDEIKMAAIRAMIQICLALHSNVESLSRKEDFDDYLNEIIILLNNIVNKEESNEVVIVALEGFSHLLCSLKENLQGMITLEMMMTMIFKILLAEAPCQRKRNGLFDENLQSEYDMFVMHNAASLFPLLIKVFPLEKGYFSNYTMTYFNLMFQKLDPKKRDAERVYAIYNLIECCQNLGEKVKPLIPQFFQTFLVLANDKNDYIRSSVIFGLGILIENGKESLYDRYSEILQLLSFILANENSLQIKENIYGVVARMILTNMNNIPVEQVFPVIIDNLPLKEEIEENVPILKCIILMLNSSHPQVNPHLGKIFNVCSQVISLEQYCNETLQKLAFEIFKAIQTKCPNDFQTALSSLTPEVAQKISKWSLP